MEKQLFSSSISTPIGTMIAIADEHVLYLVEFTDRKKLDTEIEQFKKVMNYSITPGITTPLISIERELTNYFNGTLHSFATPYNMLGSLFQKTPGARLPPFPMATPKATHPLRTQ
jgi:Methylated DNA-protein cysteine methyltransferase